MGFFEKIFNIILSFRLNDALDILLVTIIIYSAIKLLRETKAIQLVKGLILIGIVYIVISGLKMKASTFLFQSVFSNIVLVLLILFQPEIRHIFESLGRSNLTKKIPFLSNNPSAVKTVGDTKKMITSICKACAGMSDKKIGALIVIERGTLLGEITNTGTVVDAVVSEELIGNIFYPKSPLHDGAAVLRNNRVYAAGCILPLTQNANLSKELGTRHRAALGISEESDAVIIVVSEETGYISIAFKGELKRDISDGDLREFLLKYLIDNSGSDISLRNRLLKTLHTSKIIDKEEKQHEE